MAPILTAHARAQAAARGISETEVVQKIGQLQSKIAARTEFEVRVCVKRLPRVVRTPDGSTGDLVVACIDPRTMTVKTVMLRCSGQAGSNKRVYHINF